MIKVNFLCFFFILPEEKTQENVNNRDDVGQNTCQNLIGRKIFSINLCLTQINLIEI